jgi:hypothetical protein
MDVVRAIWKDGQVLLDGAVDWPDGSRLLIEPDSFNGEAIGVREEDWSNTPEAIAAWLKWYDSLEPLIFTPDEEADLAAWRKRVKEYTIANMEKNVEGLFE